MSRPTADVTAVPAAPRRMAPEQRRQHLIDVAFGIFASRPYEEVTLEEIADAAGVRRTLIYHYFPEGKPDIFGAAFRDAVLRAVQAVDTDPEHPLDRKLAGNLRMFLDLAEREDPIYGIYREGRRVNHAGFESFLAETRAALAADIAFNQLGTREPPPAALIALQGFLVFGEAVIDAWAANGGVTRAEVEELLTGMLADVVARARAIAGVQTPLR